MTVSYFDNSEQPNTPTPGGSSSSTPPSPNDEKTAFYNRRFKLLQSEVIELDAASATQLSTSNLDDDEMLNTARKSISLAARALTIATFRDESDEEQRSRWSKMSADQQRYYVDGGYSPPAASAKNFVSWWEWPQHLIAKAIDPVLGTAIDRVIDPVVGTFQDVEKFRTENLQIGDKEDWYNKPLIDTPDAGSIFESVSNLSDDLNSRSARYQDEISGQSAKARAKLKAGRTKYLMEKNGVRLSEDEWQNLFYRYGKMNVRTVFYRVEDGKVVEDEGASPGAYSGDYLNWRTMLSQFADWGNDNMPGTNIPSWLRPTVGAGRKLEERTENFFEPNPSGNNVADEIFEQFRGIADEIGSEEFFKEGGDAAWDRSDNDADYVRSNNAFDAFQMLEGNWEHYELAKAVAQGKKVYEYLIEKGVDPESQEMRDQFTNLQNDVASKPNFKNAVDKIKGKDSLLTWGTSLASGLGISQDSAAYTAISGTADATNTVLFDPLNIAGPAVKWTRIIKYGIAPSEIAYAAALDTARVVERSATGFKVVDGASGNGIKIIQVADNPEVISRVTEASSNLRNPNFLDRLTEKGVPQTALDQLKTSLDSGSGGLIDAEGYPTQFLLDHYDEVQSSLLEQGRSIRISLDSPLNGTRSQQMIDTYHGILEDIDVLSSILMRTGKPILDPTNGPVFNWLQKTSLRGTTEWMDRVVQGFEDARNGVPNAIVDLIKDLPYGRVQVPVLKELETKLAGQGLTGITSRADLWKWLQTDGLYRLGTSDFTGLNIRGFGNGAYVRNTWRTFGRLSDEVYFSNRQSLAELPRLTSGTKFLRQLINSTEDAQFALMKLGKDKNFLVKGVTWAPRKAAKIMWALGNQVPENKWIPLAGEKGVVEFSKLLNYGVLAGMDKETLDKFLEEFVQGIPVENVYRGASTLFDDEIQSSLAILDNEDESIFDEAFSFDAGAVPDPDNPSLSLIEFLKKELQQTIDARADETFLRTDTSDEWGYVASETGNILEEITKAAGKKGLKLNAKDEAIMKIARSYMPRVTNPTLASRILVEKKFMRALFEAGGVLESAEGRKLADDFLNHVERFRYTPNDEDLVAIRKGASGVEKLRIGVMPISNYAGRIGIPNVKELVDVMQRISMTSRVLRRLNGDFLTAAMTNVWKPLTLMRLGFIPRAAGEEYLAFYARRGIWAPLSSIASNIAEDRRGFIFGPLNMAAGVPNKIVKRLAQRTLEKEGFFNTPLNHLGKLSRKVWGAASRAGYGEELANLATILQFKNKADYMAHVAETLSPDAAQGFLGRLSAFDHLQISSAYHTARIIRSMRSFEFKLLPKQLQRGVLSVLGQSDNALLSEGLGLIDIATLDKAMKRDVAMLSRNALGQQAYAEQQASIGGMIAPANGIEDPNTQRLVIKKSSFDRSNRGEVILIEDREWNPFDPADGTQETMLHDVAPIYTLIDNDPVMVAATAPLLGKLPEDDFITHVDSLLMGTTWEVDATVQGFEEHVEQLDQLLQILQDKHPDIGNQFIQLTDEGVPQLQVREFLETVSDEIKTYLRSPSLVTAGSFDDISNTLRTISWAHYQTLTEEGKTNFVNRFMGTLKNVLDDTDKERILAEYKERLIYELTGRWSYEETELGAEWIQLVYRDIERTDQDLAVTNFLNDYISHWLDETDFSRRPIDTWVQTYDPANPYYHGWNTPDESYLHDPVQRQKDYLKTKGLQRTTIPEVANENWRKLFENDEIQPILDVLFDYQRYYDEATQSYRVMTDAEFESVKAGLEGTEAMPLLEQIARESLIDSIWHTHMIDDLSDPSTWGLNKSLVMNDFMDIGSNTGLNSHRSMTYSPSVFAKLVDVDKVYDDIIQQGLSGKEIRQLDYLFRESRPFAALNSDLLSPEQIIPQEEIENILYAASIFTDVIRTTEGTGAEAAIGANAGNSMQFGGLVNLTADESATRFSDENIAVFEQYVRDNPQVIPNANVEADATQIIAAVRRYRELTDNYVARSLANDAQYYIDEQGNLVLSTNASGRNSGNSISTAHTQYSLDFTHMWGNGNRPTVLIDREFAGTTTRGLGADQPQEIELATSANPGAQTVVPAGKFIIIDPTRGRTQEVLMGRVATEDIYRPEMLEELNQIVTGSLDPAESRFWRTFADGGVETFYTRAVADGTVARLPYSRARRVNVDTIAGGLNGLQSYVQELPEQTKRMLQQFMQGDIAFKGETGVSENFLSKGIDVANLPPAIREALKMYPTGSRLEKIVIEASRLADEGNDSLMEVLEFLVNAPKRIGQAVLNPTPISIADPVADRAAIVAAAKNNLMDPDYRFFLDANPRSIQMPTTGQQVTQAPLTGTTTLYSVVMDEETVNLFKRLRDSTDDPLRGFAPIRTALLEKGATPEEVEIINHLFNSFDSDLSNQLIGNSTATIPLSPIGNIAFTDFDQAERITELITGMVTGAGEYMPYTGFSVRPSTEPYAATAKVNVVNANNTFEKLGNYPSVVNITDETVPGKMKVIFPDESYVRYNDAGELDDFGQHVAQGVNQNEPVDAWAETVADLILSLFTNSSNGGYLHEILSPIHAGNFGVDALAQVPMRDFPRTLLRPTKFATSENVWNKLVAYGFGEVIGPAVYSIVRSPMYMLSLSDGLEWARAVTDNMRDKLLDTKFDRIIKRVVPKNIDPEDVVIEIQNAWSMIPMGTRYAIADTEQFIKEINGLVYAQKLDPESILTGVSEEDLATILDWVRFDANLEKMQMEIANNRAINDIIPFIDDHKVRSVFQEKVRNLIPFQFAQESFLKRWVKTTIYSPEAFRRVQLLVHGLNSSGFVQEDPVSGERVFVFPMTESLQELMGRVPGMNAIFGGGFQVPVANALTGKINNVLPGVPADFQNLPALSPLGMIPASIVAEHFPESKPYISELSAGRVVNAANFGDLAKTTITQFIPANYQRMWAATFGNTTALAEGELEKNTIMAMAQMESQALSLKAELAAMEDPESEMGEQLVEKINELSLPEDASDVDIERHVQKATNWARSNMLLRAFLGFVAPTSPQNQFEGAELAPEFGELIRYMDPDEALAVFLSEHPDGQPWSIFVTSKTTKAPLTPSERALGWMTKNRGFMDQYPKAAPWLMPQAKESDEMSQQAFTDFVAYGFKKVKEPEEWYRDLRFASAANRYFPNKLRKDVALENAESPEARRAITDTWNLWSQGFLNQHPIFANQLASQVNNDAELVLRELSTVINFEEDELPDINHLSPLRTLIRGYDEYMYQYDLLKGQNSKGSREKRNSLRTTFLAWGQTFVVDNPEVQKVWTSLILPATDLKSTATLQAAMKGD